ncbi:hypothetical protein [Nocardia sp. NPDC004750]
MTPDTGMSGLIHSPPRLQPPACPGQPCPGSWTDSNELDQRDRKLRDDDASQQKFGGGADDLAASEPWFIAELDADRPRRFPPRRIEVLCPMNIPAKQFFSSDRRSVVRSRSGEGYDRTFVRTECAREIPSKPLMTEGAWASNAAANAPPAAAACASSLPRPRPRPGIPLAGRTRVHRVRGHSPGFGTVDSEVTDTGTGVAAAERRRPRGSHAIADAAPPSRTITIIVTTHQTNTVLASLASPSG